jgi:molybdate transport system ATP-binding protein
MTRLVAHCTGNRGGFACRLQQDLTLDGITALFGPSGCGKTTALRMLAGLEDGCSGRIQVDDDVWFDSSAQVFVPTHRRGIGYVFQDARLFDHLNVRGNLAFAERRAFASGPRIDRAQVLSTLELDGLLARRVDGLSGGERQRVAIARTLLSRPRVLLMDEPLSALDLPRRSEILGYIEALPDLFGIPIIYVTHAIDEVARLADRIMLMKRGEVIAGGPVQEILARLDLAPFTGRFEGGVVLQGDITGHDEPYALTSIDVDGQVLTVPRIDLAAGETIRLRVRARDVSVALKPLTDVSIRNVLKVRVEEVMGEAGTAYAEVRLSLGAQDIRARITRKSVDEMRLKPGRPAYALIKSVTLDRRQLRGRGR